MEADEQKAQRRQHSTLPKRLHHGEEVGDASAQSGLLKILIHCVFEIFYEQSLHVEKGGLSGSVKHIIAVIWLDFFDVDFCEKVIGFFKVLDVVLIIFNEKTANILNLFLKLFHNFIKFVFLARFIWVYFIIKIEESGCFFHLIWIILSHGPFFINIWLYRSKNLYDIFNQTQLLPIIQNFPRIIMMR